MSQKKEQNKSDGGQRAIKKPNKKRRKYNKTLSQQNKKG
jgi:hypothetical protein